MYFSILSQKQYSIDQVLLSHFIDGEIELPHCIHIKIIPQARKST